MARRPPPLTRFRAGRGGEVVLSVNPLEEPTLRSLLDQLAALVAVEAPATEDPLDAMLGISTATELPTDPALARLLPDAYPDDPQASADFRRYTEASLRERKGAAVATALATLDRPGPRRRLDPAEALAWLGVLTDLRLVLGTRLDIAEDWLAQAAALPPDHPNRVAFAVYDWLSYLQEQLVRCL
jgi:hypothetical protein